MSLWVNRGMQTRAVSVYLRIFIFLFFILFYRLIYSIIMNSIFFQVREPTFEDEDVCKFYLAGFCPNELFINTKADLGLFLSFFSRLTLS